MCGGSKSSDVKENNITTTTTTNMRDVGLTGSNAVDMAAVLQTGALESTRISAASLDTLMQTVGSSAQQLIGGASDLVKTQGEIAAGQETSELVKIAPYLAMAAVAGVFLLKKG